MSKRSFWILIYTAIALLAACPAVPSATPSAASADAMTRVEGEVSYLEKSGKNLYVELQVGPKTVGVELLPEVARAVGRKVSKGMTIGVSGRRQKGDKSVAFVIEVSEIKAVRLPQAAAPAAEKRSHSGKRSRSSPKVHGLRLSRAPLPNAPVEMIAGIGLWSPVDAAEIKSKVVAAKHDGVLRLVADTGLTELWRAYQAPEPFLTAAATAATEASRVGLHAAFYFPSFELRREKGAHKKGRLIDWTRSWAQHTLSGRPFIKTAFGKDEFWNEEGDEALWVCPNSPWRKIFLQRMAAVVRKGVDTVFIDVPYFQRAGKQMTCRCSHCQARFKKETGLSIPQRPMPGNATYHRWLWWRHQVLADFFGELRRTIRAVNPRARLVVEEYPAYVDGATTDTALDIGLVGDEVDNFAHEYSAKQFDKRPYSSADRLELATTLALYRGLDGDKPTWVLSYAHKPADSRVSAAFHLAFDASFWETKAPEMNDTTVSRRWRKKLFDWFSAHRQVFGHSRQLASVAVVYSPASRDFSSDHFATLQQVQRTLTEARVPYRVLSTRDLAELVDYQTVILPAVTALSDSDAATLRASKAALLVVGSSPSKDQLGLAKRDHRLKVKRVGLSELGAALGALPLSVNGDPVAVNLVQRNKEVQLRLANLRARPATVTVALQLAGVEAASVLALLGRETTLALAREQGDTLRFSVKVTDLAVVRLRMQ